jgi:hypothetical protein
MSEVYERTGIRYHSLDCQHGVYIGSLYHDMAKASIPWVFQLRVDCMLAIYHSESQIHCSDPCRVTEICEDTVPLCTGDMPQ